MTTKTESPVIIDTVKDAITDIVKVSVKNSLPIAPVQVERAVTALEAIGSLCTWLQSPAAGQAVENLLRVTTVSSALNGLLTGQGRAGLDARVMKQNGLELTKLVDIVLGRAKEELLAATEPQDQEPTRITLEDIGDIIGMPSIRHAHVPLFGKRGLVLTRQILQQLFPGVKYGQLLPEIIASRSIMDTLEVHCGYSHKNSNLLLRAIPDTDDYLLRGE